MQNDLLTEENFLLYCAKHYDSRHCLDDEEFYADIHRIKYIKKLITRYIQTGELKERLILNHIIVLNNVFGPFHCVRILFLKFKETFAYIKPFLILLNILPDTIINVGKFGEIYYTDDYGMDGTIVAKLREI